MSELEERRQRAREAFCDELATPGAVDSETYRALDMCVETATRVKITKEIVEAAHTGWLATGVYQHGLCAAFRAAGFEVEP
jgi:hypothetical protein